MFTKKKPLMFTKMSGKPDVENAADAKMPGDKREDTKKKPAFKKIAKNAAKKKGKGSAFFANKAAAAFVKK